jgi:hypothetical protein
MTIELPWLMEILPELYKANVPLMVLITFDFATPPITEVNGTLEKAAVMVVLATD